MMMKMTTTAEMLLPGAAVSPRSACSKALLPANKKASRPRANSRSIAASFSSRSTDGQERAVARSAVLRSTQEVNMMGRNLMFVIAFGLATLGSSSAAWSEDANQAALIKALGGAKHTLLQGIAQVAKGTEVPIEAKYEMEDGKLMLSIYTSAKGFDTAAEDNSFNEYIGDATTTTWAPKKEVFADLKHIARSAQYHALLSMTKTNLPMII